MIQSTKLLTWLGFLIGGANYLVQNIGTLTEVHWGSLLVWLGFWGFGYLAKGIELPKSN